MRKETCGTCRFWAGRTGRCHRHAPRPSTPNELVDSCECGDIWDQSLVAWPVTEEADWCGEYRPAAVPPASGDPVSAFLAEIRARLAERGLG